MSQPVDPATAARLAADDAQRTKIHDTAARAARRDVGSEAAYHLASQARNLPNRVYATAVNPVVGGPVAALSAAGETVVDHIGYRHLRDTETDIKEKDLAARARLATLAHSLMMMREHADRLAGRPRTVGAAGNRPDPNAAERRRQEAARQAAQAMGPESRVQAIGQLLSVPAHLVTIAANPATAPIGVAVRASTQAAVDHAAYARKRDQLTRAALGDLENSDAADVIAEHAARLRATLRGLGGRPLPTAVVRGPAPTPAARTQADAQARPSVRERITTLLTPQLAEFPARATGVVINAVTAGAHVGLEAAANSTGLAFAQLGGDVLDARDGVRREARVAAGDIAVDNRIADLARQVVAARAELTRIANRRAGQRPPGPPPAADRRLSH